MSKKQKAVVKAVKKGGSKKTAAPVKKQAKPAGKASAGKTSAKSSKAGKSEKRQATAKKSVKQVKLSGKPANGKAVKKQAAPPKKKPAKNVKQAVKKKGIIKKVVKAVKSLVKKKVTKSAHPTVKAKVAPPSRNKVDPGSRAQVKTPAKAKVTAVKNAKDSSANNKETKNQKTAPEKTKSPAPKTQESGGDKKGRKLDDLFSKKPNERKSSDVLAINNTIPVKAKNDISPSKIASISYSITNPVRKTDSYAVRPEKEPQGKFELEFVVHASAEMLYEFLSTPSGLSEWFCDDLNIRNGIYTFIWDDQLQQARLLKTVDQQLVRFQWVDKNDGSYFEFRIQRDDLTNDISLIITDFADTASERESSKLLWNSQVEKLMHVIGSIF